MLVRKDNGILQEVMTTLCLLSERKMFLFGFESIKKFLIHPMGVTHKPSSISTRIKGSWSSDSSIYWLKDPTSRRAASPPQREVSSTYFLENLRGKPSLFIKSLILKVLGWQKKVCSGFSIRCHRKTQMNFLANPIKQELVKIRTYFWIVITWHKTKPVLMRSKEKQSNVAQADTAIPGLASPYEQL